jgi:hypothetical protein
VQQRLAGPEVERRGAGRHACVIVDPGVADAVDSVATQQLDRGVGELAAPLGRVVLSTCSDAFSLKLTAVGRGGFSVEAGGDPLHGRLAVDDHGQPVVDDELVEERWFLIGPELDVGTLGAPVAA